MGGVVFGCATGDTAATLEAWPAIGTWQPSVNGGDGESCSYKSGPQFVEALPPSCMTNGLVSWRWVCADTSLSYDYYLSTNCTADTELTDMSYTYKTGI